MAKMVTTSINIGGTEVRQFYQFSLNQGIFAHHVFKLVCPAEALDGPQGELLSKSRNFVGSVFRVRISSFPDSGQAFKFTGLVTQVQSTRFNGHTGDVIVTGFSPTIIMDNGPHCDSWEKKAIKNIANDVVGHFPAALLSPQIHPIYPETLAYTVQYKETAWQFLSRIAATYGEWMFYNGEQFVMGPLKPKTAELVYGSNLTEFSLALQVRPGKFQQVSYDYINSSIYNARPSGIPGKAGLNDLGKLVFNKSEAFYPAVPKYYNNTFLTNQKQLDDITNIRAASQSSNMVRVNGSSTHFGVQLGNTVKVSNGYGEHTVVEVNHFCDGQGNYHNEFVAIPSTIKVPPVTNYVEPQCETQTGIVKENHDPKGLGRVRVKFHWMKDGQLTPWLRVSSPHGGGNKGMHFIPEKGEEVLVGFEGNSPTKPYVDGTVYNGKASVTYSNAGNDVKALQTRSGNKVIMNDSDGSIHVQDSKGNDMMMDGAGNINLKSSASIVLTCGNSKIEMKSDGTININGKDITTVGTETITANTKTRTVNASEKYTIMGKENTINGTDNSINGTNNQLTGSTNKVTGTNHITGGETKIDGGNVFIN
jgi:type VI secretion system secreted protein VgrG